MNQYDILKQYFGYTEFRQGQSELISHILSGKDALGIMPTGAGKSLCYQIPALLLKGITLVVSPLISLMKDQVSALVQAGIPAAFINSSLSPGQYSEAMRRAKNGDYKIIYIAPERLLSQDVLELAGQAEISMLTVDEAHCVSQWGQDFRPSYLKITDFIQTLSYRPIITAFTATATAKVREDIIAMLCLCEPYVVTTGFDRKNLSFEVQKPKNKTAALLGFLGRNSGKSGIVYCSTRKAVESVCDELCGNGFSATRYHAGLGDQERRINQDDFIYDRKAIMVATNAFGMGIDKSNVGFVVHYNMPKNIESYYQEAGRAGRDGEPAGCILLYSGQDVRTNQFLIDNAQGMNDDLSPEQRLAIRQKDRELLKLMTWYCTTTDCLRAYILRYFGETSPQYCGNCSNCNQNFETVDITTEAQKIVSCVCRVTQQRRSFGKVMIVDILHGSKNERLLRMRMDKLPTYGIMSDVSVGRIRNILDYLIESGYLALSGDDFPVVALSSRSGEVVKDRKAVEMKLPKDERPNSRKAAYKDQPDGEEGLFTALKELRRELASEAGVPAYIVFPDASLRDMCRKLPQAKSDFLNISGVGKTKMELYAEPFTQAICAYLSQHPEELGDA